MANRVLLIVEGEKTEPNIFGDVFARYGFTCKIEKEKLSVSKIGQFEKYTYVNSDESLVVIIEGTRNRIHGFLKILEDDFVSIEKVLSFNLNAFQKIFLIYDVDHNDCDDVEKMFSLFNDESSGMLLLSSPCIEVLGDYNRERREEKYSHISEYKRDLNKHWQGGMLAYIKNNFEDIMLYFLEKNYSDFNEPNIMEHPRIIVDWINRLNKRDNSRDPHVIYRYFSTVIYVAIASAKSLTKEINNYQDVKSFFESQKAIKSKKR